MEEESQESPGVLQAPPALSRPTVYCREGADFLQIIFMLSIHNLGGGEGGCEEGENVFSSFSSFCCVFPPPFSSGEVENGERKSPSRFWWYFFSPPLFPLLSFPEVAWAAVCTLVIIHEQHFHLQSRCSSHLMNPSTGILQKKKDGSGN